MRKLVIIAIGMMLLGCGNSDKPSKPKNLISKEKMSEIIYDVFLINAAKGINKQLLETNGIFPQEYIFKKHQIDSLQFALSNNYYAYDTNTYEGIIQKVKQKIEFEKKINDSIISREEREKDSIRANRIRTKDTLKKIKLQIMADTLTPKKPKSNSKVFGRDEN